MKLPRLVSTRSLSAFTIIEIALCLGIIAFALVAIIGVLPFGMRVQQQNREETIINQDATVWMDAIRNGARGYDDLTNYVLSITNTVYRFVENSGKWDLDSASPNPDIYIFTTYYGNPPLSSTKNSVGIPPFALDKATNIIGLLSKPNIEWTSSTSFLSNNVVAMVRAMSGPAANKRPQTNETILGDAFEYKVIAEHVSYVPFDTNAFDFSNTNNWTVAATNAARVLRTLQTNLYDLRLTFRWPVLPNGQVGNGRQTFRVLAGGQPELLKAANDPGTNLYFFQPSLYVQTTNTP